MVNPSWPECHRRLTLTRRHWLRRQFDRLTAALAPKMKFTRAISSMTTPLDPDQPDAPDQLSRKRAGAKLGWYAHTSFYLVINLVMVAASTSLSQQDALPQ